MTWPSSRQGLTLLETLVVVGVIGMMLGLLLPAVQKVRGAAERISCANKMKQLGLAVQNYESATGQLPYPMSPPVSPPPSLGALPWSVTLLPYLDEQPVYEQTVAAYRITGNTYEVPPHIHRATVLKTYICPTDTRLRAPLTDVTGVSAAYRSYVAVAGGVKPDGAMQGYWFGRSRFTDVRDGLSTTLLFGERPPLGKYLGGVWYTATYLDFRPGIVHDAAAYNLTLPAHKPLDSNACRGPFRYGLGRLDNDCDYMHFWSLHAGGANFVLCDGSVRFLPYTAEPVLVALATRAGGEVVELP